MDRKQIMEEFIRDEDLALKKDRDGEFYVMNHSKIHDLENRPLKLADEETWQRFFFHLMRVCIIAPTKSVLKEDRFDILKNAYLDILNYAHTQPKTKGFLFKKPREKTLSDKRILFTSFFKLNACFLFVATQYSEKNIQDVKATSYDDYCTCHRLIKLSNSFVEGGFPAMRANHQRFVEFAQNPHIIRRIFLSLQDMDFKEPSLPLNDLFWAFVMILILAEQEEILNEIVEANDRESVVSALRAFAEAFAHMPVAKRLLDKVEEKIRQGGLVSD